MRHPDSHPEDPGPAGARLSSLLLLLGLHILLVAVSQFTGLLYTVGSDNLYRRAPLYPLSLLCPSLTLLICLVLLYRLRERLTRRERLAFCVYLLAPLAAIGIQPFFQGVYVIVQSAARGRRPQSAFPGRTGRRNRKLFSSPGGAASFL